MPRPAAYKKSRGKAATQPVVGSTAAVKRRGKLVVVITPEDVQERCEELKILRAREKVIERELVTYVRTRGEEIEACGIFVDNRKTVYLEMFKHELVAAALLKLELGHGEELGLRTDTVQRIVDELTPCLTKALEAIDKRSWRGFVNALERQDEVKSLIAVLDDSGDQGLYNDESSKPSIEVRLTPCTPDDSNTKNRSEQVPVDPAE